MGMEGMEGGDSGRGDVIAVGVGPRADFNGGAFAGGVSFKSSGNLPHSFSSRKHYYNTCS